MRKNKEESFEKMTNRGLIMSKLDSVLNSLTLIRKPDFHWVDIVRNRLIIQARISETHELNISTGLVGNNVSACQRGEYSHSKGPKRHSPTCCPSLQTLLRSPSVTRGFVTDKQYQMSSKARRRRWTGERIVTRGREFSSRPDLHSRFL